MVDFEGANPQIPTTFNTDSGTAVPLANTLEIVGTTVANATNATPLFTTGSGNTVTAQLQVGTAVTGAPADKNDAGLVSFDDTAFTVDANGYVSLTGGAGPAIDTNTGDDSLAISPSGAGNFNWIGLTVANATHAKPLFFKDSATANAIDLDLQVSTEITGSPADMFDAGICSFDDTAFAVDANGYVTFAAAATFTTGSVIFWGTTSFAEDNTNFFWDDTNNRLGIGINTPEDTLDVVGNMNLLHTASENDDHALEIDVNTSNFADVKAIDIVYTAGIVQAGDNEEAILINFDESVSTGGEIAALQVLTTTLGSAQVIALKMGPGIDAIRQEVGTFGNMDSALNKAVDVLAALSSGGAGNISVFVADNDTFTIGDAATFEALEILVGTGSSGAGILPTFEYSTGVGTWATFSPVDGTNAFKNTGIIEWDVSDLSGFAVGTGSEYLIRITRTRNSLTTTPIIDEVQISALTEFKWDKNADVNLNSLTLVVPLVVTSGGTGLATLTDGGIILGSGTGAVTVTAQPTNGQLLIGSTGADPVLGSIASANGSVTITAGAGTIDLAVAAANDAILTLTGDSGGALSPTTGNINILGGPGVTVSGSGSTLTVNSVLYTDQGASTSVVADSGSISTAASTLTLPATPANGTRCEFIAGTSGAIVVTAPGTAIINVGSTASSAGGTATSNAKGDALALIYQTSTDDWFSISVQGVWSLA